MPRCSGTTSHNTTLSRSKLDYGAIVYGSVRKSYLRMLDPIQNQALRLCLGAFRTSPATSLHVEANEMPMELSAGASGGARGAWPLGEILAPLATISSSVKKSSCLRFTRIINYNSTLREMAHYLLGSLLRPRYTYLQTEFCASATASNLTVPGLHSVSKSIVSWSQHYSLY